MKFIIILIFILISCESVFTDSPYSSINKSNSKFAVDPKLNVFGVQDPLRVETEDFANMDLERYFSFNLSKESLGIYFMDWVGKQYSNDGYGHLGHAVLMNNVLEGYDFPSHKEIFIEFGDDLIPNFDEDNPVNLSIESSIYYDDMAKQFDFSFNDLYDNVLQIERKEAYQDNFDFKSDLKIRLNKAIHPNNSVIQIFISGNVENPITYHTGSVSTDVYFSIYLIPEQSTMEFTITNDEFIQYLKSGFEFFNARLVELGAPSREYSNVHIDFASINIRSHNSELDKFRLFFKAESKYRELSFVFTEESRIQNNWLRKQFHF